MLQTPIKNDPFALVWMAYQKLYDKPCEIWYDIPDEDHDGKESPLGYTNFPDDGSIPQIVLIAEYPVNIMVEIFAHELAHVAVGQEHEHDDVWEEAFDAIFKGYSNICDGLYAETNEKEGK